MGLEPPDSERLQGLLEQVTRIADKVSGPPPERIPLEPYWIQTYRGREYGYVDKEERIRFVLEDRREKIGPGWRKLFIEPKGGES